MGDTAQLALFSDQRRSLFDFMFQNFAQVTNPPLDYVRERVVTELTTHLGRQPNIFAPKELIPPSPAFSVESPLLDDAQLAGLKTLDGSTRTGRHGIKSQVIDATFDRDEGASDLSTSLEGFPRKP